MSNILDRIDKLRDEIFMESLRTKTEENYTLTKIVKSKTIDKDLKEALILISNNYAAELQSLKHYNVTNFIKVLELKKEMLNYLERSSNKKKPVFTWRNIIFSISLFFISLLILILFTHFFPSETKESVEHLSNIGKFINRISKII